MADLPWSFLGRVVLEPDRVHRCFSPASQAKRAFCPPPSRGKNRQQPGCGHSAIGRLLLRWLHEVSACRLTLLLRRSDAAGAGASPTSRKERETWATRQNPHPVSPKDGETKMGHPLHFLRERFFLRSSFFTPNTRAKILSTFFSWRCRSKAYSIWRRGTRLVISLSANTD